MERQSKRLINLQQKTQEGTPCKLSKTAGVKRNNQTMMDELTPKRRPPFPSAAKSAPTLRYRKKRLSIKDPFTETVKAIEADPQESSTPADVIGGGIADKLEILPPDERRLMRGLVEKYQKEITGWHELKEKSSNLADDMKAMMEESSSTTTHDHLHNNEVHQLEMEFVEHLTAINDNLDGAYEHKTRHVARMREMLMRDTRTLISACPDITADPFALMADLIMC